MKALALLICLALGLSPCLMAQGKTTKLRGNVLDATTSKPVSGATVTAAGDVAQQAEVTDDKGFFRLVIQGVAPGDLVRIRVEKAGYAVYDQHVVASEEIPLTVQLHRSGAAVPPPAIEKKSAAHVDPVVAHFIELLNHRPANIDTVLNALQVLEQKAPADPDAISAVVADDYRLKLSAIDTVGRLKPKQAVTNLIISLHDVTPIVRAAAAGVLGRFPYDKGNITNLIASLRDADPGVRKSAGWALGRFPQDKDAIAALFTAMGAPPKVDDYSMSVLDNLGIEDSRLTAALVHQLRACDRHAVCNDYAVSAVLKKAPLSQTWITALIEELQTSLPSAPNYEQQVLIRVLLDAGGDPAHQALRRFLAGATPMQQSRLALAWLEYDHDAKDEILQDIRAEDVASELTQVMSSSSGEAVSIPELVKRGVYRDAFIGAFCPSGVQLRAAMGVLVLRLPPRNLAWKTLLDVLRSDLSSRLYEWHNCADYAAVVPGWLTVAAAKPAIPLLANELGCAIDDDALTTAMDTLSKIGDEDTITEIQRLKKQRTSHCRYDNAFPSNLTTIAARIRSRPM